MSIVAEVQTSITLKKLYQTTLKSLEQLQQHEGLSADQTALLLFSKVQLGLPVRWDTVQQDIVRKVMEWEAVA